MPDEPEPSGPDTIDAAVRADDGHRATERVDAETRNSMGFQIMGTEHLKARCVCRQIDSDGRSHIRFDTRGCPIHEKPKPVGNDPIHPPHYRGDGIPFDCIAVVRDLSFDVGNAVKYLWRADMKNGREDIEKARWYLKDAIKWGVPFYIGPTPMQHNARCATLVRHQTDPLRRKFFQALRAQQPQWMLDAVNEMLDQ